MASTSTNVTTRVDIELDKPFHPPTTFRFPTRSYGLRNRSCQHSWFTEFSFLHYDIELDAVFCHTCQKAIREKKILETYLRTTMTQERLNNLMLLHVHQELLDKIDLLEVAEEFVSDSKHRLSLFGHFVT